MFQNVARIVARLASAGNLAESELSEWFAVRYGYAVLSVGLATSVRSLLDPVLRDQSPFPLMLLAALVTVWLGGSDPRRRH
jgi:hypothetical protein